MPDRSVHSVITSPPYWRKRRYLPTDHPDADKEIGQEPSPGEFLATLLSITDELWRVVRDDGTIWVNLGDTAAGSGGAGGDYNEGGDRAGQNRWKAASWPTDGMAAERGFPLRKSTCWIPELFGASLAYGRNLLTGDPCRQWVVRPKVTWCKPRVTPGQCDDRFRTATELIVWAAKRRDYYFDAAAIAQERADSGNRTRAGPGPRPGGRGRGPPGGPPRQPNHQGLRSRPATRGCHRSTGGSSTRPATTAPTSPRSRPS
ncbi:DNA methyltransferase [Nannocystis sp.]|uniref:DNA methyltransferase n=1 Tax=Nannocystis sp. TaxID=1962667 RepID=UPI00344C414A